MEFEDIKKYFSERNCKLLSEREEYVNLRSILKFACSCGVICYRSFDGFKVSQRCPTCARKSFIGKMANPYSKIFSFIKESGCSLLTKEDGYENNRSELEIECVCGEIFNTTYANFRNENIRRCKTCSKKNLLSRKNISKKVRDRSSEEYVSWRNAVFVRDNYICQSCGYSDGGKLQAHHLYNFDEFPEKRFEISNGITLCEKCHSPSQINSFHWVYGTKENTPDEMMEYIYIKNNGLDFIKKIKIKNNKISKYAGVGYDHTRKKWRAVISFKGKHIYIGRFDNEVDAAIAWNNKAIELFGENASINLI